MAVTKFNSRSGNGRILLAWSGGAAAMTIQRSPTATNPVWTTIVSGLSSSLRNYDYVLANDQTSPYWFRISDDGGSTWAYTGGASPGAEDFAYATATDFMGPTGYRVLPVGTGKKVIYIATSGATPAGNDANDGLSPDKPKLHWTGGADAIFNPGDHVAFENNSNFGSTRIFNYSPTSVSWPAGCTTVVGTYGPMANTRPIFIGDGSNIPVNMQATDTNISIWLENLDLQADIATRHSQFTAGTTNENSWQGVQLFCGGGSTSCGTNWGMSNCHFQNWFFAYDVEGEKVGAGNTGGNGRVNGFKIERCATEGCFGHAVSSDHGVGGPQAPSGGLIHAIDGLSIDGSVWSTNGWNPAAGNIPTNGSGSGATVFYGPTSTAGAGTTTTVLNTAGLVASRWVGGNLRYTTGPASGQVRPISANTATTVTTTAFANTPNTGDTYVIDAIVDTSAAWVTAPDSTHFAPTGRFIFVTAGGFPMYRRVVSNTATLCAIQDGWVRGTEGAIPADGTAYNIPWSVDSSNRHNCYCQESSSACTLNNTISHGEDFMLRPGGAITRFLSIKAPIGLAIIGNYQVGGGAGPKFTQATSISDAFFDAPRERDDLNTGGTAVYFGVNNNDNPALTVARSVIQHKALENTTANGASVLRVDNDTGTTYVTGTITVNDVVDIGSNQSFVMQKPARITSGTITLNRNVFDQFRQINSFDRIFYFSDGASGMPSGGIVGAGNIYWSVHGIGSDDWFERNGTGVRTRAQWTTDTNDASPTYLSAAPVFTQERRLTDYDTTIGGNGTVAHFITNALANRRSAWNPRYTAEYAISWMRQGYKNLVANLTVLVAPDATPTMQTAAAISTSAVTVTWSDASNYDETNYNIRYSLAGQNNWTTIPNATIANATSYTITGLNPGTSYDFQAQASNSAGGGPWSTSITTSTQSPSSSGSDTRTGAGGGIAATVYASPEMVKFLNIPPGGVLGIKMWRDS